MIASFLIFLYLFVESGLNNDNYFIREKYSRIIYYFPALCEPFKKSQYAEVRLRARMAQESAEINLLYSDPFAYGSLFFRYNKTSLSDAVVLEIFQSDPKFLKILYPYTIKAESSSMLRPKLISSDFDNLERTRKLYDENKKYTEIFRRLLRYPWIITKY